MGEISPVVGPRMPSQRDAGRMYGTSGGRERREKALCTEELWASQGEGPGRIEPGLAKTGLGGPSSGKLRPPWEGPRAMLGDQVFLL